MIDSPKAREVQRTDLRVEIYNKLKNVAPLSNHDILNKCKYSKLFHGVYMRDTLPKERMNGVGIMNLDSVKNDGTHWTLFYIDNEDNCYYFDSYGLPASLELEQYFRKEYIFSSFKFQNNGSYCGHLCLKVLFYLDRYYSFLDAILNLL